MKEERAIPYEFKKNGMFFSLQQRSGKVVMYACRHHETGKPRGFEVMIIQIRPEGRIGGNVIRGGECLPSTSQWGVMGWSFLPTEEERATARFKKACKHFNIRRLVRHK